MYQSIPTVIPANPGAFSKWHLSQRWGVGVILRYQYQKELLGDHQAELQRRNLLVNGAAVCSRLQIYRKKNGCVQFPVL